MKKLMKYISMVFAAVVLVTACETTELDLRVSPNDLAADQADPNLLLNSIQLAYVTNQQAFSGQSARLTRIDYFGSRDYFNALPGNTMNGVWSRTYSSGGNGAGDFVSVGILTNVQALEELNATSDTDYSFHEGVGKTLLAHSLFQLVDFIGEAAWSEAGNAAEFPAPKLDSGQEVYAAAFGLLDEAEALLSGSPDPIGAQDLFYSGDSSKWVKLINTIRLRSYKNTGDTASFNAVIAGDNFISDSADDFQLIYGNSELQPDDRHPLYAANYTPSGAGGYRSNYMMNLMLTQDDPRIRYYFYRQVGATPGADAPPDEETISCSLFTPPPHYDGFVYCAPPEGYWGRSHGNDEGGPPDTFLKAAAGVYPAAGKFDGDLFRNGNVVLDDDSGEYVFELDEDDNGVGLGLGGGGAGIEPIILASYVDFWRGEMAATDADKSAFLQAGMEKSIAKVTSFADPTFEAGALLDDSVFDATTGEVTTAVLASSLVPTAADITDYIETTIMRYEMLTGDDKENLFAEQYWIAMYGGASEAYNYYRKTGYPTTVFPNWEPNPGSFPRTLLIPQNEVINNPGITQRTDLSTQVFWDTNPAGPAFPPAN
ncbi:SusD/RagB family nutrient-binding outer membrane lipoprotein [Maribacter sp. 2308TA10-17]|uniref:SusD/RagB family nutrient-binding outer membrane lipoprotein n=1 Tax=Maribacter sp. 2308TA10-17 TaxID=3386276 RepID=UPI0039BC517A